VKHREDVASQAKLCAEISALCDAAIQFVPNERGARMMHKWVAGASDGEMSEHRQMCMLADSLLLSADLLLSQPSASGSTAFDRMAKAMAGAKATKAAALAALRAARFRVLKVEESSSMPGIAVRDVLSGEKLRIVEGDFPPLSAGTSLFGRVAMVGDGACFPAVTLTPLDGAALALATGHQAAGATGVAANTRWAEAVYQHIVRHGTQEVPGLNRPDSQQPEDPFEGADDPLITVARFWAALPDGVPDAALLQRTRQLADMPTMVSALAGMFLARDAGQAGLAAALERVMLVQIETVLRRERFRSDGLTLDAVEHAIEMQSRTPVLPAEAPQTFRALRQRVAGGKTGACSDAPADDVALARLMQRIQGLRAKTVAQGCTEQEALAAAEKVAELLDRYGLSLGELDFRAQPCDGVTIETSRRRMAPVDNCIPVVAAFFDCRVWIESAKGAPLRYVFFGLRADVAAAQYLHELVERAFDTETDAFRAGKIYANMAGERRSATNSFQIGLASGICFKLRAMQEARNAHRRSASGRDLVPVKAAMVDDEVAKLGLDFHQRSTASRKRVLSDAYAAGKQAGERFEVALGISEAA